MKAPPKCASTPCGSCPYRRDVPSGVWHPSEYEKLPGYDGEIMDQIAAEALGLFYCHQQDGHLCAGWVACHDMRHTLATRFNTVDPMVYDYQSPVPVFASGAEAAAHGMAEIENPGAGAQAIMRKIERKRARR